MRIGYNNGNNWLQYEVGDCIELMKEMEDSSVDLVLYSPPYNKTGFRGHRDNSKGRGRWSGADIAYGEYKDDMEEDEYKTWQIRILDEAFRLLKPSGSILYNHKVRRADCKASHPFEWIIKSKAIFYQQIIWDRGGTPDHNINYLDPTTELIFWLVKDKPKCNKDKYWSTEIWRIHPESETLHPAPFPLILASCAIRLTTELGDTVLDPFLGSGTTLRACRDTGRNGIGFEINPKYLPLIEKRIMSKQEDLRNYLR